MQYALRTITFFAKYYLRNACISTVEKVKIPKCDSGAIILWVRITEELLI